MARLLVLCLALLSAWGCASSSAVPSVARPRDTTPSITIELAHLLPVGARVFLEAPDLAALDALVDIDMAALRGAALAEYDDLGAAIVVRPAESDLKLTKIAERDAAWRGSVVKHRLRQPQKLRETVIDTLLVVGSNDAVIVCSDGLVDAIDAVVGGRAPSLGEDADHLKRLPERRSPLIGYVNAKTLPMLDDTVSVGLSETPRLRLDLSAATKEPLAATSVAEMVKRLPADTVAFEAHAIPERLHAALRLRLGERLLAKQLGFDAPRLLQHLGGRGIVGLVAAPVNRGPLEHVIRRGVLFAVHDIDDPTAAQAVIDATRGIELGDERVLLVEIHDGQLWISAGAPRISKRVQRDYFGDEPSFDRADVVSAISDHSFALWFDDNWLQGVTGRVDHLVEHGVGDPLVTVRVTSGGLHAAIDVALVEDVVLLALRWGIESWFEDVVSP